MHENSEELFEIVLADGHEKLDRNKIKIQKENLDLSHFRRYAPSSRTLSEITNAAVSDLTIDRYGQIWFHTKKIDKLLRCSADDKMYIIRKHAHELLEVNEEIFIKISELSKIIKDRIPLARNYSHRQYLIVSDQCLSLLLTDGEIESYFSSILEVKNKKIKSLKHRRIKEFNITTDELTGEQLILRESDFAHILKKNIHSIYADSIYSGLVVNSSTHEILTRHNIQDHHQLKKICIENDWATDWYAPLIEFLQGGMYIDIRLPQDKEEY